MRIQFALTLFNICGYASELITSLIRRASIRSSVRQLESVSLCVYSAFPVAQAISEAKDSKGNQS